MAAFLMSDLFDELNSKRRIDQKGAVQSLGGDLLDLQAVNTGDLNGLSDDFKNQQLTPEKAAAIELMKPIGDMPTLQPQQQPQTNPHEPFDFSVTETIKNIPGSAANLVGGVWNAVTSPVDTVKAVGTLGQSLIDKSARKVAEVVQGTEIEPMQEHSEDAANAVGKMIVDRYGSLEAFKRTVQEDPVGFMADISGAGLASKVSKVEKIAAAIDPITNIAKIPQVAGKAAQKLIPENAATNLYQRAAKFSTVMKPTKRDAITRTALNRGISPNKRGEAKIEKELDALNTELGAYIDKATAAGVKIPASAIFSKLKTLRNRKGGVKIESASDLKTIDEIAKGFKESLGNKKYVTPKELQDFKIDATNKINWDAKHLTGSPIKEDTYAAMASGARDALSNAIKDAPEINKALSELYQLQPDLIRASQRLGNRNFLSLPTGVNTGVGGMIGTAMGSPEIGLGIGAVVAALGNPQTKTYIARVLNKLKEGDLDWVNSNIARSDVQMTLALLGRYEAAAEGDKTDHQLATQRTE